MSPKTIEKENRNLKFEKQDARTIAGNHFSAFDYAVKMKENPSEHKFLRNYELIIRMFLSNANFSKWTNQDFVNLTSYYINLIASEEKLDLAFYKISLERATDAIVEVALMLEKNIEKLDKVEMLLADNASNPNFKTPETEKLTSEQKKLTELIEQNRNALLNINTMFTHIDNSLAKKIFYLANSKNFNSSVVDFMLQDEKFALSPSTLQMFYVAYQNDFHKLDEKNAKFLLKRNDLGKEILLGNLVKVSPSFFKDVLNNSNLTESSINQFVSKVSVTGMDRKAVLKLMFNETVEQNMRNKVAYSKELLPTDCEELFFDNRTTTAQKIGLLSKVWENKQEHAVALASMFRDEQFNKLSQDEVKNLIQTVWLSRGKDLGINPPICDFKENGHFLGCWHTSNINYQKSQSVDAVNAAGSFEITLNLYDKIKKNKGLTILSTVIHEMAHAHQTVTRFLPDSEKSRQVANLSAAYDLTSFLLNYRDVIFFAVVAPLFIQSYEDLARQNKDLFFFNKKSFKPLDYFNLMSDFKKFKKNYEKVSVSQLARDMSVAKEILDKILNNKHKEAFNAIYKANIPFDIYLNYTNELHARRDTINYLEQIIKLFNNKGIDCEDISSVHKKLVNAEKKIEHYGKDLENGILVVATELAKCGILPLPNPEEIEKNITAYIASNQNPESKKEVDTTKAKTTKKPKLVAINSAQKGEKAHE